MKLKTLAIALAASSALAAPAFAADLPVFAPAPAPVVVAPAPLFQGFTFGVAASAAIGNEADRVVVTPLKALIIEQGILTGQTGGTLPECLQDGDTDGCGDDSDSLGTVGTGEVRQVTAEQLLSGEAGVTLTPRARAMLIEEQRRLAAGEPLTGLFGFTGPAELLGEPVVVEATDEEELYGFGGALSLGYQYQFDRITVGADIVGGYADTEGEFNYVPLGAAATSGLVGPGNGIQEMDYYGLARLKLGFVAGRFNPYISGGGALGGVEVQVFDPNTFAVAEEDEVQYGYTAGAGISYAATETVHLNLDYSYVDLGENDYTLTPDFVVSDLETEAHILRAGVNFSF